MLASKNQKWRGEKKIENLNWKKKKIVYVAAHFEARTICMKHRTVAEAGHQLNDRNRF